MPTLEDDLEQDLLAALEAGSSDEEDASTPSKTAGGEGTLGKRDFPDSADDHIERRKYLCYNASDLSKETLESIEARGEKATLPPPPPSAIAPTLTCLSAPCILSIISRLSPEDLCSFAQTNRYFRVAASDPGIWRALLNHRWSSRGPDSSGRDADSLTDGTFNATSNWKEIYLHRDGAEVTAEARRAPEEARDMFLAMAKAKRSEPLSPRAAAEINPLLGTALEERVAAFRRIRGIIPPSNTQEEASANPAATSHYLASRPALASSSNAAAAAAAGLVCISQCSKGCNFVELEANYWICEKCASNVHICGDACTARHVDNDSEMLVCSLTGRCFPRLMSEWEEFRGLNGGGGGGGGGGDDGGEGGARDGEDPGGGDWNEVTGMGGRLGRAFFAGYNATDEQEMLIKFGIRM
ncbi:hypothetical protein Ndes2526B_g02713 [Nannochloris sp. 'desiccata']